MLSVFSISFRSLLEPAVTSAGLIFFFVIATSDLEGFFVFSPVFTSIAVAASTAGYFEYMLVAGVQLLLVAVPSLFVPKFMACSAICSMSEIE